MHDLAGRRSSAGPQAAQLIGAGLAQQYHSSFTDALPGHWIVLGVFVAVLLIVGGVLVLFASSGASLRSDPQALAKVDMPLSGGTVQSISAVSGPHSQPLPVELRAA